MGLGGKLQGEAAAALGPQCALVGEENLVDLGSMCRDDPKFFDSSRRRPCGVGGTGQFASDTNVTASTGSDKYSIWL